MEYGQFLRGIEPVTLGLDSAASSLNRDVFWSLLPKDARRVLSSKYTLAVVADDYFDVEAVFSVAIQRAEEDGPIVQALKIDCVFWAHFHAESPVDRKHAQKFTETESWLIFWPFFRQFVFDTTTRMSIPPVMVPLALGPGEHSARLRTTRPSKTPKPRIAPKKLNK